MQLNVILKDVYQHCMDMQKMAETKNAGLIAFNGAIVLAVIKLLTEDGIGCFIDCYLCFVLLCSIIAIFLCLSAITAQLKHKEQEIANHQSQNLLFFGTIANYKPSEYLNRVLKDYNIDDPEKYLIDQYANDQSKQIVINAQIALRKFKLFNLAFKWTIMGIATPFSVIIYFLFYDNNK